MREGTNVVLTTSPRAPGRNYVLTVNGVRDIAPMANTIPPNSMRPVTAKVQLISLDDQWAFFDPIHFFNWSEVSGTEWRTDFDYDHNDYYDFWLTGRAPFVADELLQELPTPRNTPLSFSRFVSAQFRAFTPAFNGSPAGGRLTLRHLVDDGAVFYINGPEVLRFNMPAGPILTNTPASSQVGVAAFRTEELSLSVLNHGTNLVAVELHQVVTNDIDKVFAMELTAVLDSFLVGPAVITSDPEDQEATEGDSVTFSFAGVGAAVFQWRRNGEDITGANDPTYTLPVVGMGDDDSLFSVRAANAAGDSTMVSADARLTVLPDGTPPIVLFATGYVNQVTVVFNEALDPFSATNASHYSIWPWTDIGLPPRSAEMLGPEKVLLTFDVAVGIGKVLHVTGITDTATTPNMMPWTMTEIAFDDLLVPMDAVWLYDESGEDLSEAWRAPGFDDSSWPSGPGMLGTTSAPLPKPIRTPLRVGAGIVTYYFRTRFRSPKSLSDVTLRMSHILDDGAVFFLNGEEVRRTRMPAATDFSTLANEEVGDAVLEGPFDLKSIHLREDENVLAVEAHQAAPTSTDIVFGAEFKIVAPIPPCFCPPPTLTIERGPSPDNVTISWRILMEDFVLERTMEVVNGPWISFPLSLTVQATNIVQPIGDRSFFYRLREAD